MIVILLKLSLTFLLIGGGGMGFGRLWWGPVNPFMDPRGIELLVRGLFPFVFGLGVIGVLAAALRVIWL